MAKQVIGNVVGGDGLAVAGKAGAGLKAPTDEVLFGTGSGVDSSSAFKFLPHGSPANTLQVPVVNAPNIYTTSIRPSSGPVLFEAFDSNAGVNRTFATLSDAAVPSLDIVAPAGGTIGVEATEVKAQSYKAADDSVGITTTVTTASLVGKTITIKNGLIVGFA